MQRVSHSSLKTFQTCPQKWVYSYVDKRVPNSVSPALQTGQFVHEALDAWWVGGKEACRAWLIANSDQIDGKEAAKVTAMLANYNPPREDYELVGNEVPFEASVLQVDGSAFHGVRLVGFVDSLLRRKSDGKLVVRECKTSSEVILGFGPFWERLAIDSQVGIYAMVFDVDEVIYDVLRKPQLKPSKADEKAARSFLEDGQEPTREQKLDAYKHRVNQVIQEEPDAWFQWRSIHVGGDEKERARVNLHKSVKAFLMAQEAGVFPMHPGSCRGFGTCKYLGVCTGREELSDPVRFKDKLSREEREAANG